LIFILIFFLTFCDHLVIPSAGFESCVRVCVCVQTQRDCVCVYEWCLCSACMWLGWNVFYLFLSL